MDKNFASLISVELSETNAPPPDVVMILLPLKLKTLSLPNEPHGLSFNFEPNASASSMTVT